MSLNLPALGINFRMPGNREMILTYWSAFDGGPPRPVEAGRSVLVLLPLTKSLIHIATFRATPGASSAPPDGRGFIRSEKSSLPILVRRMRSAMQLNAITAWFRWRFLSRVAAIRAAFSPSVTWMTKTKSLELTSASTDRHSTSVSGAPQLNVDSFRESL